MTKRPQRSEWPPWFLRLPSMETLEALSRGESTPESKRQEAARQKHFEQFQNPSFFRKARP
jgi:hypothetical protein